MCSRCGWRSLLDFDIVHYKLKHGGFGTRAQSWCKTCSRIAHRGPNWVPVGEPRHPETAKLISEVKTKKNAERRKEQGLDKIPPTRICTSCYDRGDKKEKPASEFYFRRRKTANGEVVLTLSPTCKTCERRRSRRWYQNLTPDQMEKQIKKQKHNTQKRAKERKKKVRTLVEGQPFLEWFDSLNGSTPKLTEAQYVALKRLRTGETRQLSLEVIDSIIYTMERPDILPTLYPDHDWL